MARTGDRWSTESKYSFENQDTRLLECSLEHAHRQDNPVGFLVVDSFFIYDKSSTRILAKSSY